MPLQIIRNDITKVKADAIVNTANPDPVIGGGTDRAIYDAAGSEKLLKERQKIGSIARGEVAATPAFDLNAKYILHTVGPSWIDGNHGEFETLRACYRKSLELSAEMECKSIAFPLIATGVYRFPKDEALSIALGEFNEFLLREPDMTIILVVFDKKSFVLSAERFGDLQAFIDENYVGAQVKEEYRGRDNTRLFEERYGLRTEKEEDKAKLSASTGSLDDILKDGGQTFQQRLLELIDQAGIKDSAFYQKAGITKQVFSTIRSNVDYQPKKETAIASALALELDMEGAEDLLKRAGYAFSSSSRFDLIIKYCIDHKLYGIMDVNEALFKYDQKLLKV